VLAPARPAIETVLTRPVVGKCHENVVAGLYSLDLAAYSLDYARTFMPQDAGKRKRNVTISRGDIGVTDCAGDYPHQNFFFMQVVIQFQVLHLERQGDLSCMLLCNCCSYLHVLGL
jgi:hypothetical protein